MVIKDEHEYRRALEEMQRLAEVPRDTPAGRRLLELQAATADWGHRMNNPRNKPGKPAGSIT